MPRKKPIPAQNHKRALLQNVQKTKKLKATPAKSLKRPKLDPLQCVQKMTKHTQKFLNKLPKVDLTPDPEYLKLGSVAYPLKPSDLPLPITTQAFLQSWLPGFVRAEIARSVEIRKLLTRETKVNRQRLERIERTQFTVEELQTFQRWFQAVTQLMPKFLKAWDVKAANKLKALLK